MPLVITTGVVLGQPFLTCYPSVKIAHIDPVSEEIN